MASAARGDPGEDALLGAEPPSYDLAAFHSAEIPYVFGYDPMLVLNPEDFSTSVNPWREDTTDHGLWLDMLGYFARFAASSNPSVDATRACNRASPSGVAASPTSQQLDS